MRVVAGAQKGRRLKKPDGNALRPTSARVREALFSILSPRLRGARVADLYAGTGALGLESLSRGAAYAVFVERDTASLRVLRENVTRCGYDEQSAVLAQDVDTFLASLPFREEPPMFDIVFADPPYHTVDPVRLLARLGPGGAIAPLGLVVLEHFRKHAAPSAVGPLTQTRQSRYGDTMLTFFQHASDASEAVCD